MVAQVAIEWRRVEVFEEVKEVIDSIGEAVGSHWMTSAAFCARYLTIDC